MTSYAELVAASNFSFLRGASHPQDLVAEAFRLGHQGLGIADRNSVAGVVRAHVALKALREDDSLPPAAQHRLAAFRLVTGARLVFADGTPDIIAHPESRTGWGDLCRLLTLGNRRAPKGECHLTLADLLAHHRALLLIVMPPRDLKRLPPLLAQLGAVAGDRLWLAATMPRRGDDARRLASLEKISTSHGVPLIASNDVLYATPEARDLQDVLTCIRTGRTITSAGRLLEVNGERHLKSPAEMARLFAAVPEALAETGQLLARVKFSLAELRYDYPDEPVPAGYTAQAWLEALTWQAAAVRYAPAIPDKVKALLTRELALIARLDYARYFLTVHDIVGMARARNILCQGRGSAANSAVCYVLGITSVDPAQHNLLFARFISEERREPPDIDVDFEHERREEVIQHIYARYGRHRAGLAATVIRYRARSAIREVGKALGLTEDVTAAIAGTQWGSWESDLTRNRLRQAGLDPDNAEIARAAAFAARLIGFPRHLSQHVGGFVLARGRLDELVPIGNAAMAHRTFIEWDKDDIDALGLMKVDVLALGMLTCIAKAFALLRQTTGQDFALHTIREGDRATYAMLQKGDSIGVFQVESRAQMAMLPRLKPACFYDLVIEVAIVRPGPIQGNMVHPYLKNRANPGAVAFPRPAPPHNPDELRDILGKTLGVPLFQEQAMALAMVAAEFTDVEANRLRRAMATFRHVGTIHQFEHMLVERMVARGYDRSFAQNCFEQIRGFGSYGFPESHAASFARLVYVSAFIKCHHPAVFACALLNSQPMGFYAPAQIVRDAREHGVELRPIDVNHSNWDNTLEEAAAGVWALRLGLRQVSGFAEADARALVAARGRGFASVEDFARRTGLGRRPLQLLADADGFGSLGLNGREALWRIRRLPDDAPLPLFAAAAASDLAAEHDLPLPEPTLGEQVVGDYQATHLSLKAHPMALLRAHFAAMGATPAAGLAALCDGTRVQVAGVVLVRQRPGTGKAIFITLEDETGIANVMLWASELEPLRAAVMGARLMLVKGRLQKSAEGVIHLMADDIVDQSSALGLLLDHGSAAPQTAPLRAAHPRQVRILPGSRDFH